jgi:hypothetical protein
MTPELRLFFGKGPVAALTEYSASGNQNAEGLIGKYLKDFAMDFKQLGKK